MRKLVALFSLVSLAACAEKLTGPEAQQAVRVHRNEAATMQGVVILVDGVEVDTAYINKLDEKRIESVEVFKGREVRERFGNRAARGVIQITLKKGG